MNIISQDVSQKVILPNNRTISFSVWGNIQLKPLIYFHGFPGSRLEGLLFRKRLENHGFYVIAVDRWGYGSTSPPLECNFKMWASDIKKFLEIFNISSCALCASSGGVPYALACAKYIETHLISSLYLISGMGPPHFFPVGLDPITHLGLRITKKHLILTNFVFNLFVYPAFKSPLRTKLACKIYDLFSPKCDKNSFKYSLNKRIYILNNYLGFKQKTRGVLIDLFLFSRNWDFDIKEIPKHIPKIILHGKKDHVIHWQMSWLYHQVFPEAIYKIFPNEGHFSTIYNHLHEFLT